MLAPARSETGCVGPELEVALLFQAARWRGTPPAAVAAEEGAAFTPRPGSGQRRQIGCLGSLSRGRQTLAVTPETD